MSNYPLTKYATNSDVFQPVLKALLPQANKDISQQSYMNCTTCHLDKVIHFQLFTRGQKCQVELLVLQACTNKALLGGGSMLPAPFNILPRSLCSFVFFGTRSFLPIFAAPFSSFFAPCSFLIFPLAP